MATDEQNTGSRALVEVAWVLVLRMNPKRYKHLIKQVYYFLPSSFVSNESIKNVNSSRTGDLNKSQYLLRKYHMPDTVTGTLQSYLILSLQAML